MTTRTSKGRIVVVTPNEPYPFGQANGRWCHALLTGLTESGWQVRCLSVTAEPEWERGAREMFAGTTVKMSFYPLYSAANGGFSLRRKWRSFRQPYSYPLSDALRRDLAVELRKGYDVLHLEQLWSGYLANETPRTLTSVHHLEWLDLAGEWHPSLHFLQSKAMMTWAEKALIDRLTHIRATTDRLKQVVTARNPRASVHVVPNALDPSLFEFEAEDRSVEETFGFIASMNWSPGYLAAERLVTRVFPKVRARKPNAKLLLVGWNANRLAAHGATPGVEILENVLDAKTQFLRMQVFAYPLPKGSGMMVKVLEAMAYGIPVVTTTEGIEGFRAEHGVHALIADDDDVIADHIVRLLSDAATRRSIRRQARALVEELYSPSATVATLERVYSTLS
jgi:glycosyltransferase involved in cell wall biosynthesis